MRFDKLKRCFIIAEISSNHGQDYKRAVALVKEARRCGADAVKFQAYTPDTMTLNLDKKHFLVDHPKWGGKSLYELYKKAATPWEWFKNLKKLCDEIGIIFLCTAFDKSSVDMLENLDIVAHKVASFELVDIFLIEHMAKTEKPIIMSTGMATKEEIRDAVNAAKRNGASEIVLLKCVSSYPAKYKDINLKTIADMQKRFKCEIGLSDHTLGMEVAIASVCMGSRMIEKHFTLSRSNDTADNFFSLEPSELKSLIDSVRNVEKAIGDVAYGITKDQEKSLKFRRSLFAVKDIRRGELFTERNLRVIRPGDGLAPKYYKKLLGKTSLSLIKRGTPIKISHYIDEAR